MGREYESVTPEPDVDLTDSERTSSENENE